MSTSAPSVSPRLFQFDYLSYKCPNHMSNPTAAERVQISNTFLIEARRHGQDLFELKNGPVVSKTFRPRGGTLNEEKTAVLSLLAYCALVIEARANHLVESLVDTRKLTRGTADAVQWLSPLQKWLLLPTLYGSRKQLHTDNDPHKAVADICRHRNDLMHVKFKRLSKTLPSGSEMLRLFQELTFAMADLNVVLGRDKRLQKRLIAIGKFP